MRKEKIRLVKFGIPLTASSFGPKASKEKTSTDVSGRRVIRERVLCFFLILEIG